MSKSNKNIPRISYMVKMVECMGKGRKVNSRYKRKMNRVYNDRVKELYDDLMEYAMIIESKNKLK